MIHVLSNTWYCGGSATQPYRLARPRIATVAYRLSPAANENPIVRPSEVSISMSAALREERGDGVSGAAYQCVAILERQAGCRNWRAKTDAHLDRTDDQASLPHRVTRAVDRHRHDRRLPLD